jgi:Uma2 family endonuclease
MPAIVDIPEVRERLSRLTVEEYHRLDEYNERGKRTELIRGFVIEKMSKSPLHATIVSTLYELLSPLMPLGYIVREEQPLTFLDSEPEPDIAIVRGARKEFAAAHPTTAELVVEIAISSATLDRATASLYAEAQVKEYWIVLALERRVEVYRQPQAGKFLEKLVFEKDQSVNCAALPGVAVRIADLF